MAGSIPGEQSPRALINALELFPVQLRPHPPGPPGPGPGLLTFRMLRTEGGQSLGTAQREQALCTALATDRRRLQAFSDFF